MASATSRAGLRRSYRHPGHTIVVSPGDFRFTAANFPADLATVTAAGGTVLARADNKRGWWDRGGPVTQCGL